MLAKQDSLQVIITDSVVCPNCGAKEVRNESDPVDQWVFQVKANRICDGRGRWWHKCLVCAEAKRDPWF